MKQLTHIPVLWLTRFLSEKYVGRWVVFVFLLYSFHILLSRHIKKQYYDEKATFYWCLSKLTIWQIEQFTELIKSLAGGLRYTWSKIVESITAKLSPQSITFRPKSILVTQLRYRTILLCHKLGACVQILKWRIDISCNIRYRTILLNLKFGGCVQIERWMINIGSNTRYRSILST